MWTFQVDTGRFSLPQHAPRLNKLLCSRAVLPLAFVACKLAHKLGVSLLKLFVILLEPLQLAAKKGDVFSQDSRAAVLANPPFDMVNRCAPHANTAAVIRAGGNL